MPEQPWRRLSRHQVTFPILEHDPTREALIEPARVIEPRDVPEHCVICFFSEVIEKVVAQYRAKVLAKNVWKTGRIRCMKWLTTTNGWPFFIRAWELPHCRRAPGRGNCVGLPEVCGMRRSPRARSRPGRWTPGHRFERGAGRGRFYHYLPPGREVSANAEAWRALAATLSRQNVPYVVGKNLDHRCTLPRDAQQDRRRAGRRGGPTVEMESAALIAVAAFRGASLGQALYGGDDLSGAEWDHRNWRSRTAIREALFWLCAEACLAL